jgi:hypothetical protein
MKSGNGDGQWSFWIPGGVKLCGNFAQKFQSQLKFVDLAVRDNV